VHCLRHLRQGMSHGCSGDRGKVICYIQDSRRNLAVFFCVEFQRCVWDDTFYVLFDGRWAYDGNGT
jgi:hypothetical protein